MHIAAVQSAEMKQAHERLREARKLAGYGSAADAAEAMGVPYGTYAGHENGSRGFGDEAERYSRFFRVRIEWLMLNKGEPRAASSVDGRLAALPAEDQRLILEQIEFLEARRALKRDAS